MERAPEKVQGIVDLAFGLSGGAKLLRVHRYGLTRAAYRHSVVSKSNQCRLAWTRGGWSSVPFDTKLNRRPNNGDSHERVVAASHEKGNAHDRSDYRGLAVYCVIDRDVEGVAGRSCLVSALKRQSLMVTRPPLEHDCGDAENAQARMDIAWMMTGAMVDASLGILICLGASERISSGVPCFQLFVRVCCFPHELQAF